MSTRQPINTPTSAPRSSGGFFGWLAGLFRRKPKNDWLNTINQDTTPHNTANDDFMRMNNVDGNRQG